MPSSPQEGLAWKQTTFDLVPVWTRDPSTAAIEHVCRKQLNMAPGDPCIASFHAEGLFNKVYLIRTAEQTFVMRVTLPVYPFFKTRAEVTTLRWVREHTKIPVPRVFGFDGSNDNEIGFEWILMEFMEGISARKQWRTMTMEQKVALAEQLAEFHLQLSIIGTDTTFKGIGSLQSSDSDMNADDCISDEAVAPGRLVSHEFFMGDHANYDIPRGPFGSTHEWLTTLLDIIIRHQSLVLEVCEDEDDRDDAEEILPVAQKLLALIPRIFPSECSTVESTALQHQDLSLNNILVGEKGQVTAVLDWECVSALPLWMLSQVPKFLDGEDREEEPQRDKYRDKTPAEAAEAEARRNEPDYQDDEGKNELYWIHRMDFETTQLRKVFRYRLKELCPVCEDADPLKLNFYQAVSQCDGIWVGKASRWADAVERGESIPFDDA
ncbi:hypothetical protein NLU13_1027 [Sarocladium strictum]|uniref:Aminoglycoside phosphotransferase domain-containing protein n=1 Tax=Sarocladium strictum TaxID=5046 RepID=A0AA39GSY8_SARSR|nr:hypothetical protein NLU13_1027 [Sarocladium strictum]